MQHGAGQHGADGRAAGHAQPLHAEPQLAESTASSRSSPALSVVAGGVGGMGMPPRPAIVRRPGRAATSRTRRKLWMTATARVSAREASVMAMT